MCERARLALRLKPVIAERAKEQQGMRTDICQKSDKSPIDTKMELGYVNTKDAIQAHVEEEDRCLIQRSEIATLEKCCGWEHNEHTERRRNVPMCPK